MGDVVAIAGATGNYGLEVVRAAHAGGLRVRALVRNKDPDGILLSVVEAAQMKP